MGRRPKQTFPQRHTDGLKAHAKMLLITNYWRNANQNYNEVPPHTGQKGHHQKVYKYFPGGSEGKASVYNVGDLGSSPGLKIPWRRKWQYTPVLLPGKSHGLSLEGDRLWGRKESRLSDFSFHFYTVDENVNCATAMENSLEFPQQTRIAK